MSVHRFADPKLWRDLRLGRAKNFNFDLAAFLERIAHGSERELRRIAISAKVAEHDAIDFSRQQFFDHARRRVIGKMSVARLDPLLDRPGPMRVLLQKFFVVISFDDQRVHLAQSLDDHLGRVAEVGHEAETARASIKRESDRIDGIVRNGKRLHSDVTNCEFAASPKNAPGPMLIQRTTAAHRFGGLRIGVNRNIQFSAENFETANVVAMFVCQQDAVELLRQHPALLEPENDLPRAQSAVDQDLAMIGCDERTISGTAAAEHRQTEHGLYLATAFLFSQIKFVTAAEFLQLAAQGFVLFYLRNRASGTNGFLQRGERR
jgi:hypothetical protein